MAMCNKILNLLIKSMSQRVASLLRVLESSPLGKLVKQCKGEFLFLIGYPQSNTPKRPGAWLIHLYAEREVKLIGSGSMIDIADFIMRRGAP
jgi:hypothetical protein